VTPEEDAPPTIRFRLNGDWRDVPARPDTRLAELTRDAFGLTAARTACAIGRCGACMVLMDGRPVNACLAMAWQVDGAEIVTAEGLDAVAEAAVVKAALAAENAFQCGYCAPGFVVTLTALLRSRPAADEREIRRALEGNLCRCTGYHSILRGALRAFGITGADA